MTTDRISRRTAAYRNALVLGAAFSLAAIGLTATATSPAYAVPNSLTCRITTYYKTADMDAQVGVRTTCPGGKAWGRTSPYKEVEVVTIDTGGGGSTGGGGGGKLPCEFLAEGCSNLPTIRYGN